MAKQLIYSAVDEGVDGGRSSLCYAAASEGALLNRLVLQNILPINSYQQLYKYPATGPDPNPVNYCHYRLPAGPTEISVLSRICAAPLYGGRSNFFAHHIIVDGNEQKSAGPAQIITKLPFKSNWDNIQKLPLISIPNLNSPERLAKNWKAFGFDPGWAGWLAEKSVAGSVVHILYPSGINPLLLISDAISVLAEHQRWKVTFSTYYTLGGNGPKCSLRFIPVEATSYTGAFLNKSAKDLVLNLNNLREYAPTSDQVLLARGERIEAKALPEFSESPFTRKEFDLTKIPQNIQFSVRSSQNGNIDVTESEVIETASDSKNFVFFSIIILGLLVPPVLTFLMTYTIHFAEWKKSTEDASVKELEIKSRIPELEKDLVTLNKTMEEKTTSLNAKSKELIENQTKLKTLNDWVEKNKPVDLESLDAGREFLKKDSAKLNIKIQASLLKPAIQEETNHVIIKNLLTNPDDILKYSGKVILNPEVIKEFIISFAKKSLAATPLEKGLEARNWVEHDKKKILDNISYQTWLKNFNTWAAKSLTQEPKTIPQSFNIHNFLAIVFIFKLAENNLYIYSELNEKAGNLPAYLNVQRNVFKPKILLDFLKSNPGATNALTDFLKSKNTDKIFSWANEVDTKNSLAIEGKIGSLPLEIKEALSKDFLDHVNANLDAYSKKIMTELGQEYKAYAPSVAILQLLLDWTEINVNKVLAKREAP